jgi:hypothetical protein
MDNGWRQAVERFLADWRDLPEVTGAMVCGSWVTGNPSAHSDIDLHIILRDGCPWRERGNRMVFGYHIEYFANPAAKHRDYARDDASRRRIVNAHMFATGEIIFDATGELADLVEEGRADVERRLKEGFDRPGTMGVDLLKYRLWDMRDNLEEAFEAQAPEFAFIAHNMLSALADIYGEYLGYHELPEHRLGRLLGDSAERRKYRYPRHPDGDFAAMLLESISLRENEELMAAYARLSSFVLDRMGGFSIDGWTLRSSV